MPQKQKEKLLGGNVGVPLSIEQRQDLQVVIQQYAPGTPEGKVLRVAWLYFRTQLDQKGPIPFIADLLGA